MKLFARRLLTPGGWRENQTVEIRSGWIERVEPGDGGGRTCEILTPGLVDIHCHGGEGYDYKKADRVFYERYLMRLTRSGVTDVLFTTGTQDDYASPLSMARDILQAQEAGAHMGAQVRGVHLEGPFLSRKKPGAMNADWMPEPSAETFDRMFGAYEEIIRVVSIAPENGGARELAAHLMKKGIRVQAGHTDATYDEAAEAFCWGVDSLCHTFNAARSIHHREPGVVTAALLNDQVYCEAICDFKHLHPAAVQLIYRMKGAQRMAVISDSVAVTGLPDGEHEFGGKKYLIINGTQRVNGGETLSGGACYLDGSVRNLISIGIPAEDAFTMASRTPAERIGLTDTGRIQPGMRAHLAAWDGGYHCEFTMIGDKIYEKE